MAERQIGILDGQTFVLSAVSGDILPCAGDPAGLFYRDMRHLSRWQLRLNGRELDVVVGRDARVRRGGLLPRRADRHRLPQPGHVADPPPRGRRRHARAPGAAPTTVCSAVDVEISLLFDADFADLFEVKDELTKPGELYRSAEHDGVTLGYRARRLPSARPTSAPGRLLHRGVADVPGVAAARARPGAPTV